MDDKYIKDILFELTYISEINQIDQIKINRGLTANKSWLKENCTIKLCGPRGSGHDYAAAELIKDTFGNVWYIAPNEPLLDNFKNANPNLSSFGGRVHYFTAENFSNKVRGLVCPTVVILNPVSLMSQKLIDCVYDFVTMTMDISKNILIVHLQ